VTNGVFITFQGAASNNDLISSLVKTAAISKSNQLHTLWLLGFGIHPQ
jgi:hypothetical protein